MLRFPLLPILALLTGHSIASTSSSSIPLDQLQLPPGFSIEVLSDAVPNARQMALSDQGVLFVGTRREGKVYAIPDALTAKPGTPLVVAEDLIMPSGLAVVGNDLWVGAVNRLLKFKDITSNPVSRAAFDVVVDDLPTEKHHGWKYLHHSPSANRLYFGIGAPCNICLSEDPRFAGISSLDLNDNSIRIEAFGVRNTVGITTHPTTGDLWFSDNGRDMLGDDTPAEEINRLQHVGSHFGYPFIHAGEVVDPEFGEEHKAADYVAPVVKIQAHSAALGIIFYPTKKSSFPKLYRGALFVAEHGSWNRSKKVGFRVSTVTFDKQGVADVQPFISGWLQGEDNWGRPNDVLVAPDGSLLIADDQVGAIYRVRYTGS